MSGVVIGTVGSPHDVLVDRRGTVTVGGRPWSLDWWVGASDRWHEPGPGATQRRVDGLPVVETSLRVPGGQVVHRAWGVAGPGGTRLAVVDVENRSKEPVALALVLRGGRRLAYDGDRGASVDGTPAVAFGRRPARTGTGDDDALRSTLGAGGGDAPAPWTIERAGGAFVFPLAHTAALRLALPLDPPPAGAAIDPAALPDADAVLRGWRGHVDAGVRVGLPDERLAEAVVAARATLLIRAERERSVADAAAVAAVLDGWGHHDAAAAAVDAWRVTPLRPRRRPAAAAAAVAVLAAHARATGDAEWAEAFVGPVAKVAHRLAKAKAPPSVQLDAADLLERAGQPDAAALCRERAARPGLAPPPPRPAPALPPLDADPVTLLAGVRAVLVDDAAGASAGRVDLLPVYPDGWLGQGVEAHGLPTRTGRVSFAVRWHGARPALLWEREGGPEVELRCPGLDPAWSSTEPAGEALLGPVEPPGGLPKVVAPLPSEGTPASEAGEGGGTEGFR